MIRKSRGEHAEVAAPAAKARRISGWLRRSWPTLAVLAVALPVVSPFLVAPPLSHDHPVHIFKAWHFWTEMLGRGRLRGWTPFYGFGYPSGELTSFGPEAWVAAFRVATFGALSWLRTYGIAFAGVLVFAALGTLSFTRRQFGVGAGVIAAVLSFLDPGDWAEGGWFWHTNFGVWPVTLAMGFVLFALAKLLDVLDDDRPLHVVCAGALIAASVLVHQLPITVYPVVIPLLLLDRRLRQGKLEWAGVLRLLTACSLGIGLVAFYALPMLARSNLTQDLGVLGSPPDELGRKFANGTLFSGMWPPLFVLGGVGAILAIWGPRYFRPFVPLCTLIFAFLSSNVLIHDLHLERLVAGLIKIEAHRFLLVSKLFWFPLIGHAVASLARLATTRQLGPKRNRHIATALFALAATPLAWPAASEIYRTQVEKHIPTPAEAAFWKDLSHVLEWSKEQHGKNPERYRTAYALPMHDHLSGIAPVFDHSPLYKVGYTPAQQFNRFPMSDEPWLLEALSVKYLVSDHRIADTNFSLEQTFGALRVYHFERFRPEPFELTGEGQASLLGFQPELIRIGLKGTRGASRLRLHVASFPRWRATLNGVEVPITTVTVHDSEYPILMEVPVGDGELEFRYVRRAIDWIGLIITLLTLCGLATASAFRRPLLAWARQPAAQPPWLGSLRAALRRSADMLKGPRARMLWGLVAVTIVVASAFLWRAAKPPLPTDSIFRNGAAVSLELAGAPCEPDGVASFRCGSDHVSAGINSGIYGAHYCMNAPATGPLVVRVQGKVPRFVAGRYDTAGGSGEIQVDVADRRIGQMPTRDPSQALQFFQFDTRADAGKPLTVTVTVQGAPLHCFDIALVP